MLLFFLSTTQVLRIQAMKKIEGLILSLQIKNKEDTEYKTNKKSRGKKAIYKIESEFF